MTVTDIRRREKQKSIDVSNFAREGIRDLRKKGKTKRLFGGHCDSDR